VTLDANSRLCCPRPSCPGSPIESDKDDESGQLGMLDLKGAVEGTGRSDVHPFAADISLPVEIRHVKAR
jgi:hypothetical protein